MCVQRLRKMSSRHLSHAYIKCPGEFGRVSPLYVLFWQERRLFFHLLLYIEKKKKKSCYFSEPTQLIPVMPPSINIASISMRLYITRICHSPQATLRRSQHACEKPSNKRYSKPLASCTGSSPTIKFRAKRTLYIYPCLDNHFIFNIEHKLFINHLIN